MVNGTHARCRVCLPFVLHALVLAGSHLSVQVFVPSAFVVCCLASSHLLAQVFVFFFVCQDHACRCLVCVAQVIHVDLSLSLREGPILRLHLQGQTLTRAAFAERTAADI